MFKNMKIGMRLGLGFGLVLVLLSVIAFVGVTRLATLNAEVEDLVKDKYPKTVMANDIIDNINLAARSMRNVLIMEKRDEIQHEIERISNAHKVTQDRLEKLEAVVTTDKGKDALKAVALARGAYDAGEDRFLKLIADGKQEEAKMLLLAEVRGKPVPADGEGREAIAQRLRGDIQDEVASLQDTIEALNEVQSQRLMLR